MQDETGTGKDTLPKGQSSEQEKGTSAKPPRTYTEEEVKKAISNHEAAKGREWKALTERAARAEGELGTLRQEIEETRTQLTQLLQEKDEMERESARNNPDLLDTYQRKQALRKQESQLKEQMRQLTQSKAQHEAELKELRDFKVKQMASEIAGRYEGVEADVLLSLTDGTPEKMEALAKVIAKSKEAEKPWPEKPDSGVTSGGGEKTLEQKLKDRYPTMK